ncbi:MAG: pyrroline-5-carboxylate reductase family protein, partial [Planctomycetota bacterium]
MLEDKRIAVIGAGKLGETILSGLFDAGTIRPDHVVVTAAHQERLDVLRERLGVEGTLSNPSAVEGADVVLLGLKPQTVGGVVEG